MCKEKKNPEKILQELNAEDKETKLRVEAERNNILKNFFNIKIKKY